MTTWERCEKGKVRKVGGSWFIQGRGMQGESKTLFLFMMLIKGTKEQDGLKIYLCGRRDGKTLLKPSTSCQKLSGVWGYVKFVITG